MKKRIILLVLSIIFLVNVTGCSKQDNEKSSTNESESVVEESNEENKTTGVVSEGIVRRPSPVNYNRQAVKSLSEIEYPQMPDYLDLISCDLSALDLSGECDRLYKADFDCKTKWPESIPEGFKPEEIINFHKNPGLGLKEDHSKGITGKGVNIGFIDKNLLVDHIEYKDRVKYYDELNTKSAVAHMHASAVVSIAAGKNIGVAPEADIYLISCENFNVADGKSELDYSWEAQAIDKMIELNKNLAIEDKIRVLSISAVCSPEVKGYDEFMAGIERAKQENIFVICGNSFENYENNFCFYGLDIKPLVDKDDFNNYYPMNWDNWIRLVKGKDNFESYYLDKIKEINPNEMLLIPLECKTMASPTGNEDYMYNGYGGWSWIMPYIAGVYALACQVKPDISPEEFWSLALETGESRSIELQDKAYGGKIINPVKLIDALK